MAMVFDTWRFHASSAAEIVSVVASRGDGSEDTIRDERLDALIVQADAARKRFAIVPPIVIAVARKQDTELLDYYLQREKAEGRSVDLDEPDEHGATALWHVTMDHRVPVLAYLLERGAKVDVQKEPSGLSPLMVAAMAGDRESVELLLGHGAMLNLAASDMGATALTMALQSGQVEMAEFLLSKGASIDLTMKSWKFLIMLLMRSEKAIDKQALELVAKQIEIQGDETNLNRFRRFEDSVYEMAEADDKAAAENNPDSKALEDWDEDFFAEGGDGTKAGQDEL